MDSRLDPRPEPPGRRVGVKVPRKERGLEEHDTGVPDGRRAAQHRQQNPGDHRLDEEQERGADEDREPEQINHVPMRAATFVPWHRPATFPESAWILAAIPFLNVRLHFSDIYRAGTVFTTWSGAGFRSV